MMPIETQDAVNWALQQEGVVENGYIVMNLLVDTVRKYFNEHNIECRLMSFDDLKPYLPSESE